MIVEIRRIQFINKGAELMLLAILDKLESALDDVTFTVAPDLGLRPYERLAPLAIHPKAWLWRHGIQWGYVANKVPPKLLKLYGIVSDSQVDVVLDASGFAYGDQWGPPKTVKMARATRRWRRQGTKVILLPQAFGPFTSKHIRKGFEIIAKEASRLYARDIVSFGHIEECAGAAPHIRQCPDITVLIPGETPVDFSIADCEVAIIPNQKMIEKGSVFTRAAYLPFLVTCLQLLTRAECKPFFLIHGGPKDEELAHQASRVFGHNVPVIIRDDAVETKGIIGACRAVVSSRYHGLVSALSQGVPAIGTGWSHKYRTLFDYYGCPNMLLSPNDSDKRIETAISVLIAQRGQLARRLHRRATQHATTVNQMWDDVLNVISEGR